MSDSILKRYVPRAVEEPPHANRPIPSGAAADSDGLDDFGAFGYLRGVRDRAVMLEFRRKDGSIKAKGYGWLEEAEFEPSGAIILTYSGEKIRIHGRNLNADVEAGVGLYRSIVRHKVPWIQEADHRAGMTASERATIIDSIEW